MPAIWKQGFHSVEALDFQQVTGRMISMLWNHCPAQTSKHRAEIRATKHN